MRLISMLFVLVLAMSACSDGGDEAADTTATEAPAWGSWERKAR